MLRGNRNLFDTPAFLRRNLIHKFSTNQPNDPVESSPSWPGRVGWSIFTTTVDFGPSPITELIKDLNNAHALMRRRYLGKFQNDK